MSAPKPKPQIDFSAFTPEQQAQLRAAFRRQDEERRDFFMRVRQGLRLVVAWLESVLGD